MVKHTIDHYISNLLYYNECVVVPGFGAFITRYYPAEINSATHMFRPPSKRVTFNARIHENDGLLAKHIAQTDEVSYEKALESIDISTRSWKKLLRAGKKVNLNGIGRLYMSDKGKLQFNPAHDINYDINSYGLNIFRANAMDRDLEIKRSVNKAIEKHQVKKGKKLEPQKPETVVRDINYRRWVGILGPVAAMLVVGVYLYTNPASVNTVQQQVSGIFLNDSSFRIEEKSDLANLTDGESSIGFSDGPRLNGDFGPEDDVINESTAEVALEEEKEIEAAAPIETEIASTESSGDLLASAEETPIEKPLIESPSIGTKFRPASREEKAEEALALQENLNPNSSDNAVSNDLGTKALKSNKGPSVKNLAEELDEDNYYLPEKPLYHVKKRPDGENYQEDNSYSEDYGSGYTNTSGIESPAKFENTSMAAPEKEIAKPKTEELTESKTVASPIKSSPSTTTSTKVDNAATLNKPVLESGVYQVVVGAFSSQANASRYAQQLQANGWVAYSYLSGNLYRVAVGKLDNRSQAERLLTQIKQQVNAQAWVNLQ